MIAVELGCGLEGLRSFDENSVHSVITDPPYGLAKMGGGSDFSTWEPVSKRASVKNMPGGQPWSMDDISNHANFMRPFVVEVERVLRPGGVFICVAAPRTYAAISNVSEEAGLEVRDMLIWHFTHGQPKSMPIDGDIRTPMIAPQHEPAVVAWKDKGNLTYKECWE